MAEVILEGGAVLRLDGPNEIRAYLEITKQLPQPAVLVGTVAALVDATAHAEMISDAILTPELTDLPVEATVAEVEEFRPTTATGSVLPPVMPPVASTEIYVNHNQLQVIDLLRHCDDLSTREIEKELKWPFERASTVTSAMARKGNIVAKRDGHQRYFLTELGQRAVYKITPRPSTKRPYCAT